MTLLEVLSGNKLQEEKGRILKRPHFLSNCNTALEFLRTRKVKETTYKYLVLVMESLGYPMTNRISVIPGTSIYWAIFSDLSQSSIL